MEKPLGAHPVCIIAMTYQKLSNREFEVLDTIKTKKPNNIQETVEKLENEVIKNNYSYSQVRTTINNLQDRNLVVLVSQQTPGQTPVETEDGLEVWNEAIDAKYKGDF